MEFFERAHVVKNNKTTEKVKKQLKQMLHGYKLSDNKLIQNSAESKVDYDDSTSVSGFSDLNLTNSSCEDNVTDGDKSLNEESSISFTDNIDDCSSNIVSHEKDFDSLSEEQGNTTILSEERESEVDVSSISESEESLASAILDSDLQSDSSELFDKNGELALRIHKRLEQLKSRKETQKRKHSDISATDEERHKPFSSKEKCRELKISQDISEQDSRSVQSNENIIVTSDVVESDQMSPPFVSITAVDMPHQRLDDIIGEYKYSTIRNLPSDNQHTIFSTNNSGFFTEEIMNVDINTEDEIGSLVPELDDIPTIEEIDEVINLDTTVDTNVSESVIDLENTLDSESTSETEQFIDPQINVEETFKIYYTHMGCIIVLKHPSELYIQGKVKIKRLGGTVEVFGYTLKDEFCDLYAPYYHFAQSVKTIENPNSYYGLFGKLTASGMSVSEAEYVVTSIGDQDGVILLQSLHSDKIEFIEDNFKITYLFVKLNKVVEPYFKSASDILKCSLYSIRPLNTFRIHPSWREALSHSECPASRGIVCGGKGAGKSTYLRYQVNKLLANGPVLVVDLDPGQCEFTVAGNVSASVVTSPLLGPNFTHLKKPEIMLNIGMINTMDNSKRYLTAVHTLVTQCRENKAYANMPWVINTMGMTTALGLKFITYIILITKPTYILQYESKKSKKYFNTLLQPRNVNTLYEEFKKGHLFENISFPADLNYSLVVAYETDESLKDSFSLTPKDERYLNFLAYFSQLASIQKNLLAITPYQVSLKALYIGTNVVVKADNIAKVINGKLVALCQQKQCDNERVFTLADKPLLCHGHGKKLFKNVRLNKFTISNKPYKTATHNMTSFILLFVRFQLDKITQSSLMKTL